MKPSDIVTITMACVWCDVSVDVKLALINREVTCSRCGGMFIADPYAEPKDIVRLPSACSVKRLPFLLIFERTENIYRLIALPPLRNSTLQGFGLARKTASFNIEEFRFTPARCPHCNDHQPFAKCCCGMWICQGAAIPTSRGPRIKCPGCYRDEVFDAVVTEIETYKHDGGSKPLTNSLPKSSALVKR